MPEGKYLYQGAEYNVNSPVQISDEKDLINKMEVYLKPEPNTKILWMRPKLWFYNIFDTVKKDKGFKHWVKYKLGEPPVYLSDVDMEGVSETLKIAMENNGFFSTAISYNTDTSKNTASVSYSANVKKPYQFGEIHLPQGDDELSKAIRTEFDNTDIRPGLRYSLEAFQNERIRLEKELKNKGFYYFADNYILYKIDSTVGDKKVEVFMTIKDETPLQAKRIQQINQVMVNTDFDILDSVYVGFDTLQIQDIIYIREKEKFRPKVITRQIQLRPNDIYTRNAEEITISRLIDLGVFKYVNIHFKDSGPGQLDALMRLSPMKKKSIQLELQGVTKSNSFVGPAFQASFSNRNFLKGAELYQLSLTAGYEWQIGARNANSTQSLNSYELGIVNSLKVPKFITPFKIDFTSNRYVPQTIFQLGFRMLKRINYFQLNSFDLGYGLTWRETTTKTHKLFPVDVSYLRLSNPSDEFKELLEQNLYLRRSYENQFILGSRYSFIYNSQARPENLNKTNNFYFNYNIDISGNLMHLLQKGSGRNESTTDGQYTIFGSPYSQYMRTDFDFRYYFRIDKKNKLATRLIMGIGRAYGNSDVMPFTKQFTIGGSSSIRAFRARSVGPGAYKGDPASIFIDQTADIKIETNVEYRFDLVGDFKGAVFIDAGNIWSLREDERPGGRFNTNSFLSEIAVGTGVGIRLDIQFFVLRLDLATPLKVPSRDPGERWQLRLGPNRIDPNVSNLILNIAIGYPF